MHCENTAGIAVIAEILSSFVALQNFISCEKCCFSQFIQTCAKYPPRKKTSTIMVIQIHCYNLILMRAVNERNNLEPCGNMFMKTQPRDKLMSFFFSAVDMRKRPRVAFIGNLDDNLGPF